MGEKEGFIYHNNSNKRKAVGYHVIRNLSATVAIPYKCFGFLLNAKSWLHLIAMVIQLAEYEMKEIATISLSHKVGHTILNLCVSTNTLLVKGS